MYILKNALRSISRSKGRNILIGIIVLVISISTCLGLSIRQAAQNAKTDTLDSMTITATISFDRQSMMSGMMGGGPSGGFDRDSFSSLMNNTSSLTLEEYETYAELDSVKYFYYSMSASLNQTDDITPVSIETENTSTNNSGFNNMFGGMTGGMPSGGKFLYSADFSLTGYSSEKAMISFINGSSSITEGTIFTEGLANYECIITEELAIYNDLSVGDTFTLANANNEEETYTFTITGLYVDSSSNNSSTSMNMFSFTSSDPANTIYMSYATLQDIIENSIANDEENKIQGTLSATYTFANTDNYYTFEEDVRNAGLDENYVVNSTDITSFENSLVPLNTLSTMATTFLIVILVIGAIILIVLNIFNIRERKYEIGVLCAMGMKKGKVAIQFLTEIFIVTLTAVFIGIGVGAVASVPVTNALLENQVVSQQTQFEDIEANFGRGEMPNMGNMTPPNQDFSSMGDRFNMLFGQDPSASYVTEISSAMNFTVVWQMLGIAILLTTLSGTVSMFFVMRYDPIKILANRD